MIEYFCHPEKIESKAAEQLKRYSEMPYITKVCVFPDIHYCSEKGLPVGVAFASEGVFYPLITGKDLGCGVAYARISKESWNGPFDKSKHYIGLEKAHREMTDDGLGGGNHFLSIEEDDTHIYVICHTGSRNRGIAMYQRSYELVKSYASEIGNDVNYVNKEWVDEEDPSYFDEYYSVLDHAQERRAQFVIKTIIFLQRAGYIIADKNKLPPDYLKQDYANLVKSNTTAGTVIELNSVKIEYHDSMHNHLEFIDDEIIHRKGATEINAGDEVAIPLSMTRGTLIVKAHHFLDTGNSLYSCSHGAGRELSRFDAMKHWKTVLKEKERKQYKEQFSELLDRSGNFPSGYLQEFDYAYKDSSEILKLQPNLIKVTQTRPIVTVKYTEI